VVELTGLREQHDLVGVGQRGGELGPLGGREAQLLPERAGPA
jgi:hypothetical protein